MWVKSLLALMRWLLPDDLTRNYSSRWVNLSIIKTSATKYRHCYALTNCDAYFLPLCLSSRNVRIASFCVPSNAVSIDLLSLPWSMQQLEPSDELKCRVVYWLTMDDILGDIVPILHTIYSVSCAVCLVLSLVAWPLFTYTTPKRTSSF